jgi:hypothetical protein
MDRAARGTVGCPIHSAGAAKTPWAVDQCGAASTGSEGPSAG